MFFGKQRKRFEKLCGDLVEHGLELSRISFELSLRKKDIADLNAKITDLEAKLEKQAEKTSVKNDDVTSAQLLKEYLFGVEEVDQDGGV